MANKQQVSTDELLQPVPMSFGVFTAETETGWWIGVRFSGPTGTHVAFLQPDATDNLAQSLTEAAESCRHEASRQALQVVKSPLIVPGS